MSQAQAAARRLGTSFEDAALRAPVVEQLVRCAKLSQNAARTLDWAVATLGAHATARSDMVACQLLRAARARLDGMTAPAGARPTSADQPVAWL